MTKKLSGSDWRLLSAILAVIFLLVGTELSEDCQNCMEEKLTVTFSDQSDKKQYISFELLPNAYVIVHSAENKNLKLHTFAMVSGQSTTIQLEGQEAYTYMILELDWSKLDKLSAAAKTVLVGELLWASKEKRPEILKPYKTLTKCISVGIILVDTTISFTSKGEIKS